MNVWNFRKGNDQTNKVNQFLRYAKSNPNEILELEVDEIESILKEYADSLKGINADNTIINKVHAVILFFSANGMEIENDLVFDYSKEDFGDDFEE